MLHQPRRNTAQPLRTICTARTQKAINQAAREGFRPLLKRVEAAEEIRRTYAVLQHRETSEILIVSPDPRIKLQKEDYDLIIGPTTYYPYSFPTPYAAYLLPADLHEGERVFLEDVIEDRVIFKAWSTVRLESSEATWNGKEFDLHYDMLPDRHLIG